MTEERELKRKGDAAVRNGEWAEAVQWYTQLIEKNPDISAYYSFRATCQAKLGRHVEGIQDVNEALKRRTRVDPISACWLYLTKAECQESLGAVAGARISFEQALSYVPNAADLNHKLQKLMLKPLRGSEGDESLTIPVNILDTLPDAYSGAETPTVLIRLTVSSLMKLWHDDATIISECGIPGFEFFTPPSGHLTHQSLKDLSGCHDLDLPLAYSYLFYNVDPCDYRDVHMDYRDSNFVINTVAAELVADKSIFATRRAIDILTYLGCNESIAASRIAVSDCFVSELALLRALKALKGRASEDQFDVLRGHWFSESELWQEVLSN